MPAKDYYQTLGVPLDADADRIKKAYRALARENHPDANPDDPGAEERFKEVSEAYRVLSDPEQRQRYDRMRKAGSAGFGGFRGRGPAGRGGGGWQQVNLEDLEDLEGLGGGAFSDLFSSIFGGRMGGGPRRGPEPRKGPDRQVDVRISFEVAARGGKVTIRVPMEETCPRCEGRGNEPGTPVQTCPQCGGSGQISLVQGGFAVQRPCPRCYGRGTLVETPCRECHGEGTVTRRRQVKVRVPAGTEAGERIRMRGKGEPGVAGGPPGDLFLTVRIKPDSFFRRDGLDIHCTVPIGVSQAMGGTKIRVRTIHDQKVELTVPPGTQGGTRLRLKGQGIEKGDRVGDQFVEIQIRVPDVSDLTEEERVQLEQLTGRS